MAKPTKADIRRVMSYLGSKTSKRKTDAVRKNGKLGGRPPEKKLLTRQT